MDPLITKVSEVKIPMTWGQLAKNPLAVLVFCIMGGGGWGLSSLGEIAEGVRAVPQAVKEIQEFRKEMQDYGVCLDLSEKKEKKDEERDEYK